MTALRKEEEITKTARKPLESGSSSTTTYHTEPGVSAYDLEVIRQHYEHVIKCYLNCITASDIEQAIASGLQTSAIIDALDETAMAPRPSHYYFRAILKRYMREGITTREKAEAQRWQRRREREINRMKREHEWYDSPNEELDWYCGGDET